MAIAHSTLNHDAENVVSYLMKHNIETVITAIETLKLAKVDTTPILDLLEKKSPIKALYCRMTDENFDLEKTKKLGKTIKVSEIVKEKDKTEKDKAKAKKANKYAGKAEKEKEYLKRPEVQEAANILGDLIILEEGKVKDLTKLGN